MSISPPRQESITLESLELLQRTLDFLNRLPVVPVTRNLIREIEAHLASPETTAARRDAENLERIRSKRFASLLDAVGFPLLSVVLEGESVSITAPPWPDHQRGFPDLRIERLAHGLILDLEATK